MTFTAISLYKEYQTGAGRHLYICFLYGEIALCGLALKAKRLSTALNALGANGSQNVYRAL